MSEQTLGEIVSLFFMSIALGMDAFSVSLGIGMQRIRLKQIAIIGFVIGIFHVLMPLLGILAGQAISDKIGNLATLTSGLLLVAIGSHMLFSAFNHEVRSLWNIAGIGLFLFALSVSMDSFSVGLSLGISGVQTVLALGLFGTASMVLTWLGMLLGRKMNRWIGAYSEILGGSILCAFGLLILFG
ncbi:MULTISPECIES: manganese efflux pump MntP family protein [unclassified Virgibacillus]|uniref:manganese efflux pump MntP n=1 Tax=unclassified Virgibacillus TaxID=2620237 RepID=UPI0024DEA17F|nr:manganese efflux pump MntP family protein [Virgibacillus sp. LDC-1]